MILDRLTRTRQRFQQMLLLFQRLLGSSCSFASVRVPLHQPSTNGRTAPNSDNSDSENCKQQPAPGHLFSGQTRMFVPVFQQPTLEPQRHSPCGQRRSLLPSGRSISGISATHSYTHDCCMKSTIIVADLRQSKAANDPNVVILDLGPQGVAI